MARLPEPGGDQGTWGEVLNGFLSEAHNTDGSLKDISQSKVTGLETALDAKADTSAIPTTPAQVGAEPEGLSDETKTELAATIEEAIMTASDSARAKKLGIAPALAGRFFAPFDIVFIGDSIVEGWGSTTPENRFVTRFLTALRNAYPTPGVSGGHGYLPSGFRENPEVGLFAPPTTYNLGRGYAAGNAVRGNEYGLGRYSVVIGATGVTSDGLGGAVGAGFIRHTLVSPITSIDICLRQLYAGAQLELSWDNGSTWSALSVPSIGEATIRATPPSRGTYDIRIRHKTGSPIVVEGLMTYDGDETSGIRLWQGGKSGSATSQYTSGAWTDALTRTAADLIVIEWLTNDAVTVTPATFAANLVTIINNVRSKLPGVPILLAPPLARTGPLHPWADYITALRTATAALSGVVVFDVNERATNSAALQVDGLHPTNTGHALLGDLYLRAITA